MDKITFSAIMTVLGVLGIACWKYEFHAIPISNGSKVVEIFIADKDDGEKSKKV